MDERSPADQTTPQRTAAAGVNAWLVAILLVLMAMLLLQMSGGFDRLFFAANAQPRAITPRGDLAEDEKSTIELFRQASPSVVHVTSVAFARDRLSLNLFEIPRGAGSGFVWDDRGHVVTNFHVVQDMFRTNGSSRVTVTLSDNSVWEARPVGVEPGQDLAVLKIDAPRIRLQPIPVGTSSDLEVGQKVFAIGNPFNLDQTLTTGVISGLGRDIQSVTGEAIHGVIQTDAAINPGNSGGPLLDSAGRLIGVNTAIVSPSGAYAGVGFAVPVDAVNRIVPRLIQHGQGDRPGLGVHIVSDGFVEQQINLGVLDRKGVLIRDVLPDSAAAKAGLRSISLDEFGRLVPGDLIVGFDGKSIEKADDLFDQLDQHQVGDTITLTIVRDGQEQKVDVNLQALASWNP